MSHQRRLSRTGRSRRYCRPTAETLEGRMLLTLRPAGLDFIVNNYTVGKQREPDVAVAPDGTTTVVWVDDALDGDGKGIYARRFDASGQPLGNQFRINTTTAGDQINPEIAVDSRGNAVVAWVHNTNPGSERPEFYVRAQRLDATGAKVGGEIVATNTLRENFNIRDPDPHIVFRPDGGFSLLFFDQPGTYWNGSYWYNEGDFITQVYDRNGVKQSEVNVALDPGDAWESFRYLDNMAADADGNAYIPAYQRRTRSAFIPDVGAYTRYDMRLVLIPLDARGNRRGPDLPIYQVLDSQDSATVSLNQAWLSIRVPHVFIQPDGSLLVGFQSLDGLYDLQRFSTAGTALSPAVPLAGGYVPEQIERLSDGNVAGLLGTSVPFGPDGMYLSVFAPDGTALDRDMLVTGGFDYIGYRTMAAAPGGGLWAIASETTSFTEGEIRARRFVPGQRDPGAIGFESAGATTVEGQSYVDIALVRTEGSDGVASVTVSADDGTAGGGDYRLEDGIGPVQVAFADGETRKTVRVAIVDDTIFEGDESFSLSLSNPSGGVRLSGPSSTTITIHDNDPPPAHPGVFRFEDERLVSESEGTQSFRVTVRVLREQGTEGMASVLVSPVWGTATRGADYLFDPVRLMFGEGQSVASASIVIIADGLPELDETVTLALSSPSEPAAIGAVSRYTLRIIDYTSSIPSGPGPIPGGGSSTAPLPAASPAVQVVGSRVVAKKRAIREIELRFNGDLNKGSAGITSRFRLVTAGRDRKFGTADDRIQRLRSVSYDPATRAIRLVPRGRLATATAYRLVVDGIADTSGRAIDGDRDGLPGGPLTFEVRKGAIASIAATAR